MCADRFLMGSFGTSLSFKVHKDKAKIQNQLLKFVFVFVSSSSNFCIALWDNSVNLRARSEHNIFVIFFIVYAFRLFLSIFQFSIQTHNILQTFLDLRSKYETGTQIFFKYLLLQRKQTQLSLLFSPLAFSPAVANLSSYVKRGIECWSNSGFHTPLITSISVGGLTIMDSKIFQSPTENSNP